MTNDGSVNDGVGDDDYINTRDCFKSDVGEVRGAVTQ